MPDPAMTPYEREVLEMVAERRKPQFGAWVNACMEWLADNGYITRNFRTVTDKGREYLDRRS